MTFYDYGLWITIDDYSWTIKNVTMIMKMTSKSARYLSDTFFPGFHILERLDGSDRFQVYARGLGPKLR